MKLYIASDHAGLALKNYLIENFKDIEWNDLGPQDAQSVDYPDFADKVTEKVSKTAGVMGVIICGSGQGMAIRANRNKKIRAALCWDVVSARLAREHNDANVLCMGGRLIPFGLAKDMLDVFVKTPFAGGRHTARVEKLGL